MFPLWDVAIAPVLHAAQARRVIDPEPAFDPAGHEERFPGRYHFHRALELNGHGQVSAIRDGDAEPPPNFRLRFCTGNPLGPAVRDHVHELVGDGNAVVVLGAKREVRREP
ncbi:MAG: hypothetical protein ACRD07_00500 [Acidimicrobiales bacterium]